MLNRPDVIELFAKQYWVADVAQLVALDISPRTIGRARSSGAIVPVFPGVVRPAGTELTFRSRAMAVQLHCGERSFLSGPTAGVLHGLRNMPRMPIEVTLPQQRNVRLAEWARIVRSSWIHVEVDVVDHPEGFRIAHPLRMLWGLAWQFNQHRFERAAEDAWHRGLVRPDDAVEYLSRVRRSGRTGVTRFENWLERVSLRPAQSGFEQDVIDAIVGVGLPEPDRQHPLQLPSGEVVHIDLAWPDVRLGVEPGHSWWHGGDLVMRRDQARDRACDELGWRIIRIDAEERQDLATIAAQIARIHAERRRSLSA